MKMIWTLYVCVGIYWGGCGMSNRIDMPSEEACFRALAAIRFDELATGENRRSAIAYCAPKPTPPA
jgi:hypothetical protein